ncbi:hypothetical protein J2R76_003629 [Bradyrhizobium sp. USDA 4532]|nr:hypothetical protein [Bradyrhizobium sp. USDA 4545]MCP1920038.1 hypothetical protein [Bradyrhizobium sp. USDA 4532]
MRASHRSQAGALPLAPASARLVGLTRWTAPLLPRCRDSHAMRPQLSDLLKHKRDVLVSVAPIDVDFGDAKGYATTLAAHLRAVIAGFSCRPSAPRCLVGSAYANGVPARSASLECAGSIAQSRTSVLPRSAQRSIATRPPSGFSAKPACPFLRLHMREVSCAAAIQSRTASAASQTGTHTKTTRQSRLISLEQHCGT